MSDAFIESLPPFLPIWQKPVTRRPRRQKRITACDVAQVGRSLMWEWIKGGKVKVVRIGPRKTLVDRDSLLAFLEKLATGGIDNPPGHRRAATIATPVTEATTT